MSSETLESILDNKIIAIIRGAKPDDTVNIANALYNGGIKVLEITMNSQNALTVIKELTNTFGDKMLIGAGTVLDAESAKSAINAGAKFILSPSLDINTIKMTKRYDAVSIPGAYTPTEILSAYDNGADIIKVFPAILGPSFIKSIRGPLSHIPLLPTGGVNLENIKDFIKVGAVGVGLGNALVDTKNEITNDYLSKLTLKASQFVSAIR